jgi:hypothetical protein
MVKKFIFLVFFMIISLSVFSQSREELIGDWKLTKHIADMAGEDQDCAVFYEYMTLTLSADSSYTLSIKSKDSDLWKGFGKWKLIKDGKEILFYGIDAKPKRMNEKFPDHSLVINKFGKGKMTLEERLCTIEKPGLSYYTKIQAK